ncbi:hypothetical protein [Paraglaciecola sp. 2405UD69-4]|uniref:hypothetical protein n=1 Tax=Paraglaciecola sp. 2405UD69-4 TaxID=3391836 RepID=UPI0039C90EDC
MHIPTMTVSIIIASCVTGVISYFSGLSFWVVFGVTVVAMFIIVIVADVEDNAPGGFNNPSDKDVK